MCLCSLQESTDRRPAQAERILCETASSRAALSRNAPRTAGKPQTIDTVLKSIVVQCNHRRLTRSDQRENPVVPVCEKIRRLRPQRFTSSNDHREPPIEPPRIPLVQSLFAENLRSDPSRGSRQSAVQIRVNLIGPTRREGNRELRDQSMGTPTVSTPYPHNPDLLSVVIFLVAPVASKIAGPPTRPAALLAHLLTPGAFDHCQTVDLSENAEYDNVLCYGSGTVTGREP